MPRIGRLDPHAPSRATFRLPGRVGALAVCLLLPAGVVHAEGVVQAGFGQDLIDAAGAIGSNYASDEASASLYVDILSAGEVINVSLCGRSDSDLVGFRIYEPRDEGDAFQTALVKDVAPTAGNVGCDDPMDAPLPDPDRYVTTRTGAYRVELINDSATGLSSTFKRYDITVTPDDTTLPDPRAPGGRLWAYTFAFYTRSFGEEASTDADYYALVPGGREGTHYVWQLDLNNFAGNGYNLVANSLGVNPPNSGYSTGRPGNSVGYRFPQYMAYPAVALPRPTQAPVISNVRFEDAGGGASGQGDYAISPGNSDGVQDSGNPMGCRTRATSSSTATSPATTRCRST